MENLKKLKKLNREFKINYVTFHLFVIMLFGTFSIYGFMFTKEFSLGNFFISIMFIMSVVIFLIKKKD